MKQFILSNEITQKDIDNYRIKFADYLESTYQVNDVSELSDYEIIDCLKNDMQNLSNEFDYDFHYEIKKDAVILKECEEGFMVKGIAKGDIHNAFGLCSGKKQDIYIEDGELGFNSTNSGEMYVRFAKDGNIFREGDIIATDDINEYTEPVGDWLEKRMNFWKDADLER